MDWPKKRAKGDSENYMNGQWEYRSPKKISSVPKRPTKESFPLSRCCSRAGGNLRRKKIVIKNMSPIRAMTAMRSLSSPYRSARMDVTVRSNVSKCKLLEGEHSVGSSLSTVMTIKLFRQAMPSRSHVASVTELMVTGATTAQEEEREIGLELLLLDSVKTIVFCVVSRSA